MLQALYLLTSTMRLQLTINHYFIIFAWLTKTYGYGNGNKIAVCVEKTICQKNGQGEND
jgi:hypothetical protein